MRTFLYSVTVILCIACGGKTEKEQIVEPALQDTTSTEVDIANKISKIEDSVLKDLNLRIKEDINNAALYVERGHLYFQMGDMESSIYDMRIAYTLDSLSIDVLLGQAQLLTKMGRVVDARRFLEKAMKLYPEEGEVYLQLGEIYLLARSNKEALKYANLAVKHDMYNPKAYYLKGYAFLGLGDTLKAMSSFQTSIEQDPDFYEGYIELAILNSIANNSLAVDYYNNALKIRPNDKNALYGKGMYEQEHEMYNEAMQTYIQAIKAHPNFREAHYNLGYVHMYYLKLYRQATIYFTDAIEVDPGYFQAYYNRGYSFELMGDINNAAKDYRKALELQGDYELAAKGLSRVTEGI